MSTARALQILASGAEGALSPDQKNFNALIREIEQSRARLQAWQDGIFQYRQTYGQLIAPLVVELRAAERANALAMDAASLAQGWTKGEQATWSDLVCEQAGRLLDDGGADDAELKAVYERHAEVDYEEEQLESMRRMKAMAEIISGVDLGNGDFADEGELHARLQQKLQEQAAAREAEQAHAPAGRPPRHRKTAAQKRRESEAHEASLSVREVYRKLASVLHPDRETEPGLRAQKTALMQQANQAYAKEDLLTLLELQLRAEQLRAGSMADMDAGRLKHYVKVLREQARELKLEIYSVQMVFSGESGLQFRSGFKPEKLGQVLHGQAQEMRAFIAQLKADVRRFADRAATKRWLKTQRARLRDEDDMGYGLF